MGARRVVLLLVLILAVPTPAIGDTTKPKTSESNCASGSVTTARTSPRGITVESRSTSACQLGGTVTQWRTMTAFERADELELGLLGSNLPCQRSEVHTSELQSLMRISYAVFCLKTTKTPKLVTQAHD